MFAVLFLTLMCILLESYDGEVCRDDRQDRGHYRRILIEIEQEGVIARLDV